MLESCMVMKIFLYTFLLSLPVFSDAFSDYWYNGKAEIAVYDLEQSRYGEQRNGEAVLIFVTEPFSKKDHVKLDNPQAAGKDRATVLKMNRTKSFFTGIYPYSIMTSAFAEVGTGRVLKATTSVQEWCGQVYLQANDTGKGGYEVESFSYFQSEGDQEGKLSKTELSEGVMLQLRLNKLKEGTYSITPPQESSRLLHYPYKPAQAEVKVTEEGGLKKVLVTYDHPSKLQTEIHASATFPYEIKKWTETFQKGNTTQTTTATLRKVQQLPYWGMNAPSFNEERKKIGLER